MKKYLRFFIWIAFFIEIIAFPQLENCIGAIISLLIFEIFMNYVYLKNNIKNYPLSIFALSALFAFCYLPIIMTLIDGHPLTFKMEKPERTFFYQLLFVLVSVFAFACSKNSRIEYFVKKIMKKGIFLKPLTEKQIWVLTGFGFCFQIYTLLMVEDNGGGGIAATLSYFIYLPLIYLFKGWGYDNIRMNKLYVYLYIVLVMILGIGTNKRSYVFMIVFFYLLSYLLNSFIKKYEFSFKSFLTGIVIFLIASGPITDFALSMVLVRSLKGETSTEELVHKTIDTFNNKELLTTAKNVFFSDKETGNVYESWNEYYVNNLFLERYCNYRVADATLCNAYKAGFCNIKMQEYFWWFIGSSFPTPILKIFGNRVDKTKYEEFSTNDMLMKQSYGRIAGGHMVGGDVGLGLATMGELFFLIHFCVFYVIFSVLNGMCLRKNDKTIFLPIASLLLLNRIFRLFVFDDGIALDIRFIIWELPFYLVCYMIIVKIVRKLS